MNKRLTRISKYLAFILRHGSESIGMKLDPEGWLPLEELISKANASGKSITLDQVREVVAQSEAQRFEIDPDGLRIRSIPTGQAGA